MVLNQAGSMIQNWWLKIPDKFSTVELDEFVVMPNHLHGIIINVGATPCGRPKNVVVVPRRYIVASTLFRDPHPNENDQPHVVESGQSYGGQPHGVAPTLGDVMDWFKTITTNDYIRGVKINEWPPFDKRVWQRNYYDHIIRNEKSYWAIKEYIRENSVHWTFDEENPSNIN